MSSINELIKKAKLENSDLVEITKVTPLSECTGKLLKQDKSNGEWYDFRGSYIVEMKSHTHEKKSVKPGMYKLVPFQYGVKQITLPLLKDKAFSKMDTLDLKSRIQTFLDKVPKLKSFDLSIVKRGFMLHGKHGAGKTHQINTAVSQTLGDNGVAISFGMSDVGINEFIEHLNDNPPSENIDKLFVIIEDLGGGEQPDLGYKVMGSQDHLLAFLDGNNIPESWRNIPIIIFSTTNYPELFLANIIDRPGRFDEVIEVPYPDPSLLVEYAEDFMKEPLTDFDKREILKGEISIAHIKDACIRKIVYNESIHDTIKKMRQWSDKVKASLEKKEAD